MTLYIIKIEINIYNYNFYYYYNMSKIKKKKLKVDENKLDEIIEESLGDDDIRQYLPNATILKYSDLCKYNDIDEIIPNEKDYAIILYEDSPNRGHWTCICKLNNNIEFFDSYGGKIDNPLNWTPIEQRKQLNEDVPYLSNLIDKSNYDAIYNDVKYQGMKGGINTCGRHVINRLLYMLKLSLNSRDYYKLMEHIKKATGRDYDDIVSLSVDIL